MDTTIPSREHSALLAQGSYKMGDKDANKKDRVANTNQHIKDTGYVVNSDYSNSEITAYQHKDDPNNLFIAHRGTHISGRRNKNHNDITADLMFAMGLGGQDAKLKRRKTRTNTIIRDLKPTQLHMSGHSLGGGSVNHTIANSNKVKKHLTSARTFNAAAHPVFTNSSSVKPEEKNQLDKKIIHHRIKHDPVSAGFLSGNIPFGKLKTHSVEHDADLGKSYFQNLIEKNTPLGQAKRFTERGLHAHAISHFHDGSIKKKKKKNKK